jgi:hypothetical protein
MRDDDLDRILSKEQEIVPSSGFVTSVMDAVRRETAALRPIPFPWKRALPLVGAAILAVGCVLSAVVVLLVGGVPSGATPDVLSLAIASVIGIAKSIRIGWIAAALVASILSVKLSHRLVG